MMQNRHLPQNRLFGITGAMCAGLLCFGLVGEAQAQPTETKRAKAPAKPAKALAKPAKVPAKPAKVPAKPAKVPAKPAKAPATRATAPTKPATKPSKNRMVLDRVVAVVNNSVILQSELGLRVTPLLADIKAIRDPRARKRRAAKITNNVLTEMVNESLIIQAASQAKLKVKAKEVRKTLDGIKKQNKLDEAGLAQALAMQGYTIASYKTEMRRQILRMRAINMLVRPKVRISKEDVRARYDAMNRRSAAVSKVRLHHVLIALPHKPTDVQVAAAKKKASEVIRRTKAGQPFKKLALLYSDDPKTKADGGELGMIERGTIPSQWEVIVFAMEKGEVRGPISGPQGLHVFYVSEVVKRAAKKFKDVKQQLRAELYRKSLDRKTRSWLDELRKKAHVRRITR